MSHSGTRGVEHMTTADPCRQWMSLRIKNIVSMHSGGASVAVRWGAPLRHAQPTGQRQKNASSNSDRRSPRLGSPV